MLWVWLSETRSTWFRCHAPEDNTWDCCQYYMSLCTHCLRVDRAQEPLHTFPCMGRYGVRRAHLEHPHGLGEVRFQVFRRRPCFMKLMEGSFFPRLL